MLEFKSQGFLADLSYGGHQVTGGIFIGTGLIHSGFQLFVVH